MPGPIIVTATDRALFWLAKGLVLSTLAQRRRDGIRMVCFDLGLDPTQAGWFAGQEVEVLPPPDPLDATRLEGFKPYMLGQLCRPYLPDLLPGHDAYVWLDADTWVAQEDGLGGLLHVARAGLAACCPEIHPAYSTTGRNAAPTQRFWARAWDEAFGPDAAQAFRAIPMLNSGVLAIPAAHGGGGAPLGRPRSHFPIHVIATNLLSNMATEWAQVWNVNPARRKKTVTLDCGK